MSKHRTSIGPALTLVLGAILAPGCGSNNVMTPTSPPPPPLPPVAQTVIHAGGCQGLQQNFACVGSFVTTQKGQVDVTVDWTFPSDSIQVLVSAGAECSAAQIRANQCNFIGQTPLSTTPKPKNLTLGGEAPGAYTLYIFNAGPQTESVSDQVTLTTGGTFSSGHEARGPVDLSALGLVRGLVTAQ